MAPHGRNDKRLEPQLLERIYRSLNDGAVIRDSPAAARHCHRLSRSDTLFKPQSTHLKGNFPWNIVNGRCLELLSDPKHFREIHSFLLVPKAKVHKLPFLRNQVDLPTALANP